MPSQQILDDFKCFEKQFLAFIRSNRDDALSKLLYFVKDMADRLKELPRSEHYPVRHIPDLLLRHIVERAPNETSLFSAWKEMPYDSGEFVWQRFGIEFLVDAERHHKAPIKDVWLWSYASRGQASTDLGKEYFEDVLAIMEPDDFLTHGPSVFSAFYEDYSFSRRNQRSRILDEYERFFVSSKGSRVYSSVEAERVKQWEWICSNEDRSARARPSVIREAFSNYVSDILYNAENEWREAQGINRIGEGWKSETELFYRLKARLVEDEVIMHGRPEWLGRQHFDIWIPTRNVAVEYQGLQHDRPVEIFGGEKSFASNQRRDAEKREKCRKAGVHLIEVREGYNLDDVITSITESKV